MTLLLKSSSTTNKPTTSATCSQPGAVTRLTVIGNSAAIHGPTYGMIAQHAGREPPQRGVRHADEVEPDADRNTHRGVDDELHQQVAADPCAGIRERFRRDDERRSAREADEPIAQVLAIDEHEDREQQREPDGADGAEQRPEPFGVAEQRRRLLDA